MRFSVNRFQTGSALLVTLTIIAVISIFFAATLNELYGETLLTQSYAMKIKAFNKTENALERMENRLRQENTLGLDMEKLGAGYHVRLQQALINFTDYDWDRAPTLRLDDKTKAIVEYYGTVTQLQGINPRILHPPGIELFRITVKVRLSNLIQQVLQVNFARVHTLTNNPEPVINVFTKRLSWVELQ